MLFKVDQVVADVLFRMFSIRCFQVFTWKWEVRVLGFTRCWQPATLQLISWKWKIKKI